METIKKIFSKLFYYFCMAMYWLIEGPVIIQARGFQKDAYEKYKDLGGFLSLEEFKDIVFTESEAISLIKHCESRRIPVIGVLNSTIENAIMIHAPTFVMVMSRLEAEQRFKGL